MSRTRNLRAKIQTGVMLSLMGLAVWALPGGGCGDPDASGNSSDSEKCLPEGCPDGADCYSGRCLTPDEASDEGLDESDITG